MDYKTVSLFEKATDEARRVIGKPPVEQYELYCIPGPIQRAFEIAVYQDARAAQTVEERDLALAEARRQVTSTEVQHGRYV